jgi:hypothetical protein
LAHLAIVLLFAGAAPDAALGQRTENASAPPTLVGRVVAYEADASLVVETMGRNGANRTEFSIEKGTTLINLPPRLAEIKIGQTLAVWADKDNPQLAARIGPPPGGRGNRRAANKARTPGQPAMAGPRTGPASGGAGGIAPAREPVHVAVRPTREPVAGLDPPEVARQIDHQIDARLEAEKLPPSPPAEDSEFIRRVYLDIAGVIPPADSVAAFLASKGADKRARLVDELLASPDYGLHFADLWCDRLNVKDLPIHREPFVAWMSASLNANRGWDEIVSDMLTAEGRFNFITRGKRLASDEPQALFLLLNTEEGQGKGPNPAWLAGESGRLFLGVQLQCAECHDHPFTPTWKQTDFWGLAAFFGRVTSGNRGQPQGLAWQESPAPASEPVSIEIPATALKNVGQVVPARLLLTDEPYEPTASELLRHTLARWMTSPANRQFREATANRLWAHFFGRGLVNPVDDLREDNPPTHPAVLESLASELEKSQFDLKHAIRCLCASRAYQRTSRPLAANEQDASLYSHAAVRTMQPGVFYDSLARATGWAELKLGLPERKTKLTVISSFTPREVFVDFFRSRQGEEADPRQYEHGIPQALKLMNAAQMSRVAPATEQLAQSAADEAGGVEQLYLAALARRPTTDEVRLMAAFLARHDGHSAAERYSAVLWVLMNSAEFVSNH